MRERTVPQERARRQLRAAAQRWAGDNVCELVADAPTFLWLCGSTMIEASAGPDGAIMLKAHLVLNPTRRRGLRSQLIASSARLPFGQLLLDEDGDIALVHRVPAGVGFPRLAQVVRALSRLADELDDVLCVRFGGFCAVERLHQEVLAALAQGRPRSAPPMA